MPLSARVAWLGHPGGERLRRRVEGPRRGRHPPHQRAGPPHRRPWARASTAAASPRTRAGPRQTAQVEGVERAAVRQHVRAGAWRVEGGRGADALPRVEDLQQLAAVAIDDEQAGAAAREDELAARRPRAASDRPASVSPWRHTTWPSRSAACRPCRGAAKYSRSRPRSRSPRPRCRGASARRRPWRRARRGRPSRTT